MKIERCSVKSHSCQCCNRGYLGEGGFTHYPYKTVLRIVFDVNTVVFLCDECFSNFPTFNQLRVNDLIIIDDISYKIDTINEDEVILKRKVKSLPRKFEYKTVKKEELKDYFYSK